MKQFLRKEYIAPTIYLLVFSICLFLASDFKTESFMWFFAVLVLTLPWSILTTFFVMGALHLGDDVGVIVLMSGPALLNAGLLYLILKPKKTDGKS